MQVFSELPRAEPCLKLVSRVVITAVGGLHAAMHCKTYNMTDKLTSHKTNKIPRAAVPWKRPAKHR